MPESDRFCGRCGLAHTEDGPPIDPLIGIVVAGRYRIEHRIGVGGMGTVYLGVHTRVGHKVAIKVLHERYAGDQQLTQRFENEALTYARLSHPNLVSLHDYGRNPDGTFFMVLEHCAGESLASVLRDARQLDPILAVDVVIQIAQGLMVAHAAGVIHRDLKPENVILMKLRGGRFHVKLLDFGIAKSTDEDAPKLTQAGMVFGTPEYMAPEQAKGDAVDARSDVYALGAMLYELICGRPPFTAANKVAIMNKQAYDLPPPPSNYAPEIPLSIEDIILRCLEKSPEARYQSAEALIEALEREEGLARLTPIPAEAPASEEESLDALDETLRAEDAPFDVAAQVEALKAAVPSTPTPPAEPAMPRGALRFDEEAEAFRSGLFDLPLDLSEDMPLREARRRHKSRSMGLMGIAGLLALITSALLLMGPEGEAVPRVNTGALTTARADTGGDAAPNQTPDAARAKPHT
ncbi:serine/threonine protein kinase, partial [Myxococcota bacterium]|nr:serine/threonine protein kinase [Myxococcota bacterium]